MKKLMIAAAAAAMIGAAEATNYYDYEGGQYGGGFYDFTASVKTTTGKKGKDQKANYTVNLGLNNLGFFWYDTDNGAGNIEDVKWKKAPATTGTTYKYADILDPSDGVTVIAADAVKYTYQKGTFKKAELVLTGLDDETKEAIAAAFGYDTATKTTWFNAKSSGKWCQTFKYTHTDYAACYRVACSKTIKGIVDVGDCCGLGGYVWSLYTLIPGAKNDYTPANYLYVGDIDQLMLYRFGAQTLDKATKVEYIGRLGNLNQVANANSQPIFACAGQGNWGSLGYFLNVPTNGDRVYLTGVKDISGNIVGSLPPSDCQDCCLYDVDAIAFWCDAEDQIAQGTSDDGIAWQNRNKGLMHATAAFGTWSMKFNKAQTAKFIKDAGGPDLK